MLKKISIIASVVLFVSLVAGNYAKAQDTSEPLFIKTFSSVEEMMKAASSSSSTNTTDLQTISEAPKKTLPEGMVNCFDYYKFGSVYASISPVSNTNVSGTKVDFKGEIKNENPYPIVDGKLFVKIMRSNDSYKGNDGQDEVDSFVVKEGISIRASSSVPIDFSWEIPAYALSGDYQVSTYFIVDDSFNLSGLSFTTDVVGGIARFKVFGDCLLYTSDAADE